MLDIRRKTNGRKITAMWDFFGKFRGKCCSECSHLVKERFYKCEVYGISRSEATDWAKSWTACGAFNIDAIERMDLYKQLRKLRPQEDETIKGQMTFLGEEDE